MNSALLGMQVMRDIGGKIPFFKEMEGERMCRYVRFSGWKIPSHGGEGIEGRD